MDDGTTVGIWPAVLRLFVSDQILESYFGLFLNNKNCKFDWPGGDYFCRPFNRLDSMNLGSAFRIDWTSQYLIIINFSKEEYHKTSCSYKVIIPHTRYVHTNIHTTIAAYVHTDIFIIQLQTKEIQNKLTPPF